MKIKVRYEKDKNIHEKFEEFLKYHDALKATKIPCVEVHISEPDSREEFRHISYIRSACIGTVTGKGLKGYTEAMELLINYLSK